MDASLYECLGQGLSIAMWLSSWTGLGVLFVRPRRVRIASKSNSGSAALWITVSSMMWPILWPLIRRFEIRNNVRWIWWPRLSSLHEASSPPLKNVNRRRVVTLLVWGADFLLIFTLAYTVSLCTFIRVAPPVGATGLAIQAYRSLSEHR
jgi:hypothetical protein